MTQKKCVNESLNFEREIFLVLIQMFVLRQVLTYAFFFRNFRITKYNASKLILLYPKFQQLSFGRSKG